MIRASARLVEGDWCNLGCSGDTGRGTGLPSEKRNKLMRLSSTSEAAYSMIRSSLRSNGVDNVRLTWLNLCCSIMNAQDRC